MKRSFIALALLLMLCVPAFGLTDAEYRRLKRTNPDFKSADDELAQTWNSLKKSLPPKSFEELQKNQREWIRKGRDEVARKYIREGHSRADAYIFATVDRTEDLPDIADRINEKNTNVSKPDDKGEIEENRFKNTEPGDPEGNYSRKGGFMTVIITDKSSMEAAVTISVSSPKEVTWSSESWFDDDILVLYDKNYSDCNLTLTFKGNTVTVEQSESESWKKVLGEGVTLSGTYTRK